MENLEDQIRDSISNRKDWEEKQRAAYEIRTTGIPRMELPYANAPDNNCQLSDSIIEKHKPFYVAQLYAGETIAGFISKTGGDAEQSQAVAHWFDCMIKDKSNWGREAISAIDTFLESGGCPVKVRWDTKENCLSFTACDPLYVIVPKHTEELKDADWLCHVIPMSEAQYRRNNTYRQDDDFIESIKGRGDESDVEASGKQQQVDLREGLTCGKDDDEIVIWEIQVRGVDGKITVKTRSPLRYDEPVRPDFTRPYKEGILGKGAINFVKWRPEITRKGYASPRGMPEIVAPNEAFMNKCLNFVNEHMDFHSRPMFEQDLQAPTGMPSNFKAKPGKIMPPGLKAMIAPPLPGFLMPMLNYTREQTEYRVTTPDFGVQDENGGKRTATEVNAIGQQSGQGVSLRNRIFRLDLQDTILMAWALCLDYGKDQLSYVTGDSYQSLDASALTDSYEIRLSGNADAWDKQTETNKAVARFQLLRGDPYIDQGALRKDLLASDESGLVKRLYREPQDQQAADAEEQAMELGIMLMGFPAIVDPTDADTVHIVTACQWAEQTLKNQESIEPRMARLFVKHMSDHTMAAMAKKDPQIKAVNQQYGHIVQIMQQIAGQPDPREIAAQQAQLQNVVPMQQGTQPPGLPFSPSGPAAQAPQQPTMQ